MIFHIWNLSNHENETLKTQDGVEFTFNLGRTRGMWWQARSIASDKVMFESNDAVHFAYLLNMANCQLAES